MPTRTGAPAAGDAHGTAQAERYRVGDVQVDVAAGLATRGDKRLILPPLTFELLVALVRRHPGFLRREDLLDTLWPHETVTDQTLSHRVMLLRRALGDEAATPTYVAGERGWGYRVVAPVERMAEAGTTSTAGRPGPRGLAVAGSALALLLALGLVLLARTVPARRTPTASPRADTPRVQRLCLRAEFFWLAGTEDGLRRARRDYATAIELDPLCARAHSGKALAGALAALLGLVPPGEAAPTARRDARSALRLGPALAAAQAASGLICLLFDWDEARASAAVRRAAELDPTDPAVVVARVVHLQVQGRLLESLACLHGAGERDAPHSALLALLEGRSLRMAGQWTEAARAYERALALEPDAVGARLERDESLAAARRLAGAPPEEAWRAACARGGPTPVETVRACLLAGDEARARDALAAAVAGRWPGALFLPAEAAFRALAGDDVRLQLTKALDAARGAFRAD
jgi:DNA-binding winged helix-turn-helix (wHTH) protein/tetratricopeptide (TPR) repeat protein